MAKAPINRSSGVLCNISSLPSEFGIGCFNKDAENFADILLDMGFHWWQVLPITMIGYGNSPYSSLSTFAGNALYINPAEFCNLGLLSWDELNSFKYYGEPYRVDYDFARNNITRLLNTVIPRLTQDIKEKISLWRKENEYWIEDYALYMALAEVYGYNWRNWDKPLQARDKAALDKKKKELENRVFYYVFEQYEFFREWTALKEIINKKGIRIIGDIPFYVATNSVDVWANPKEFQLGEDLVEKAVAGVPPDAFSDVGQIWGNVLYDFKAQAKSRYSWWRLRIKHNLEMYDALRLDHFRAFYNYFSIPAEDTDTAKNGHWEMGPGMELLNYFKKDNPKAFFIAEDLGLIDDECRAFIDSTGIPTMRVFQFGFDGTPSCNIPYNYEVNTVCYSGTHDNNTLLGWLYEVHPGTRDYVLKYCGYEGAGWGMGGPQCGSTKAILKALAMTSSILCVFPIQDLLGYGGDTRMNIPGVAEGNWMFRVPFDQIMSIDRNFFLDVNNTYGRNRGQD